VAAHRDYVAAETLVAAWGEGSAPGDAHRVDTDLEGLSVTLSLKKA
jgi:hypothetical protein